jgi:steroid 5-alpha reductase family enzyme
MMDAGRARPWWRRPVARQLLRVLFVAVGLQLAFMLISLPKRSELLFDLSGGITFVAAFALTYWAPGLWDDETTSTSARRDPFRIVATVLACLWAMRLSGFLFWRVLKLGGDARFDSYKNGSVLSFARPWIAQAAWVALVGMPVYVLNASPPNPATRTRLRTQLFAAGALMFVTALALETTADVQKAIAKSARPSEFVSSGLYRFVRYPQYTSEIMVWISAWVMCSAGLDDAWKIGLAAASPVTTFLLLRYVSGVPLSEAAAKRRYGGQRAYRKYASKTPMLVPRLF